MQKSHALSSNKKWYHPRASAIQAEKVARHVGLPLQQKMFPFDPDGPCLLLNGFGMPWDTPENVRSSSGA